jgi:hypothetical protein
MSLQGSLSQLGLADVLQNALAGRSGRLVLRKGAERAVLQLDPEGIFVLEPEVLDPADLLDSFVRRGTVKKPVVAAAQKAGAGDPTAALDALVQAGELPREDVGRLLRAAAEDTLLDLLSWSGGEFRFEEGEPRPEHVGLVGRVPLDPGGVLLRGASTAA